MPDFDYRMAQVSDDQARRGLPVRGQSRAPARSSTSRPRHRGVDREGALARRRGRATSPRCQATAGSPRARTPRATPSACGSRTSRPHRPRDLGRGQASRFSRAALGNRTPGNRRGSVARSVGGEPQGEGLDGALHRLCDLGVDVPLHRARGEDPAPAVRRRRRASSLAGLDHGGPRPAPRRHAAHVARSISSCVLIGILLPGRTPSSSTRNGTSRSGWRR